MSIIDRFNLLNLPADQVVVIGSGLLDALNLRLSGDVDLVVTAQLFSQLRASDEWQEATFHGESVLTKGDVEIWLSWGSDGVLNFTELYAAGVTIDGVRFAGPQFIIDQKKQRGLAKDLQDVQLLEEYLRK